ncbi:MULTISPECIES: hypothetical protein [Enterobacteriaceae]|uniref:hypothetical protein n=1 Tax=Enterobacteriaceae TaxID=543 RepID=UPI0025700ED2|nr:hypothetical protein [Enterobacter sp. Ap-916]
MLETTNSALELVGMSGFKTRLFLLNKNSQRLLLLCSGLLLSMLAALIVIGIFKPTVKPLNDRSDTAALLVYSWEDQASSHLTSAKIYHSTDAGTRKDILLMVWNVKPCLLAGKMSVSAMPNQAMKWVQRELRESLRTALIPSPASHCICPGAEERPDLYKQSIVAETGSHGQTHEQDIEDNHQHEGQIQPSAANVRTIFSAEKVDARHAV